MFILKFALELSVLVILFLMLRKSLLRAFPLVNASDASQANSKHRGQKLMYSGIFLTFGFITSVIAFWVTYFIFSILHGMGAYSGVLVISQAALILPSLIIGFYISTVYTKELYVQFFGDEQYEVFQLSNVRKGVNRTFTRVFSVLTLLPAIVLLSLQFNVYLKTDGERIYTKRMLEEERIYSITDIVSVGSSDSKAFNIYLANGDEISTMHYSGNINYFLDNISSSR